MPEPLAPEPPISDGHIHVTTRDAGTRSSAADLLADMDAAGVRRAAVVTPSTLGWDNSVTFDAVASAPDRFVAIARVDLRAPDGLAALRDVLAHGARGIRVTLFGDPDTGWLGGERMDEVASTLAGSGAVAEFHCEPAQLTAVGGFATRHPEVPVLVDHLGRPVAGALDGPAHRTFLALADAPNVFAKSPAFGFFSATEFPHADIAAFVSAALDRFGAERILWGSDWPGCDEFGSYRHALDGMLAALDGRGESERAAVLGGTFDRLFGAAQ